MTPRPSTSEQVQAAIADLTSRAEVDKEEIEVARTEEVTWHDGSLGCAQKGMVYTQAMVPGSRIVLRAAGQEWEYHAGRNGDPTYCANPTQ